MSAPKSGDEGWAGRYRPVSSISGRALPNGVCGNARTVIPTLATRFQQTTIEVPHPTTANGISVVHGERGIDATGCGFMKPAADGTITLIKGVAS